MVRFLILLLIAWICTGTYCYVCHIKDHCYGSKEKVVQKVAPAPTPKPKPAATNMGFNVKDGSAFLAQAPVGAMFARSGNELQSNPTLDAQFSKLGQYLKGNPNKTLSIIGGYTADEKSPSWLENLGKSRAKAIRSAIVAKTAGLSEDQILVDGSKKASLQFNNERTDAAMKYVFVNREQSKADMNKRMAAVGSRLRGQGKNFYFNASSNEITLDAEMREYFGELSQYLAYDKKATVTLIGHTDSDGDATANRNLGKKRAEKIRQYMGQNGIDVSQITADSKGEDAPIADNNTAEGKAKNRRVEIRLN